MHPIKRGDIWLVNLDPTLGHESKKTRPSLIIQNDLGNQFSSVTIVAPITSKNIENVYPFEVLVEISSLEKKSKILLNQIRAVDKQRLVKRIASINPELLAEVNLALKMSLGLS